MRKNIKFYVERGSMGVNCSGKRVIGCKICVKKGLLTGVSVCDTKRMVCPDSFRSAESADRSAQVG